jgi:hypothetical protein
MQRSHTYNTLANMPVRHTRVYKTILNAMMKILIELSDIQRIQMTKLLKFRLVCIHEEICWSYL